MKIKTFISLLILVIPALYLFGRNQQYQNQGTQKAAKDTAGQTGEQLYKTVCIACHQADGNGVRNMFPPLAGNEKLTGPSADVIKIVLFGLQGPITVNGRDYNSQVMPAQDNLSDKQIADVLTYVRNAWGNKAPAVSPEEVAKIRKEGNK